MSDTTTRGLQLMSKSDAEKADNRKIIVKKEQMPAKKNNTWEEHLELMAQLEQQQQKSRKQNER